MEGGHLKGHHETSRVDDLGLLAPKAGALETPIRSVLFGAARFEQHGRSLAATHAVVPGASGGAFFPRLSQNVTILQRSRALLQARSTQGRNPGPAAQWLLDNAALIDEQLVAIRQGLPRSFFRLLPRLRDQPLAGLPRVYSVAWAWVAHTDSAFDQALFEAYLRAYQEIQALTLAELWALHTTLRVVLIENLRRLAERTATQQAARDAAHQWLDAPAAEHQLAALQSRAGELATRGVSEPFLLTLWQRQDELKGDAARALDNWLRIELPEPGAALARQQNEAAEDQQSIRNAITTLRELDRLDWRAIIKRCSAVMALLETSPVHAAESEATQDATLHQIERLARRSERSEFEVARLLLDRVQRASEHDDARASAAYWWRGDGENDLRVALGLSQRHLPRRGTPTFRRLTTPLYLLAVTALSIGGVSWLLHHHAVAEAGLGWLLVTAVLLLGPVSEAVVATVNRMLSESVPPAVLARLAFDNGVPAAHRSIVVVPVLIGRPDAVSALAEQLELHHLANPEPHAQFALLSDYADADAAHTDGDMAVLEAGQLAMQTLNARYPTQDPAQPARFLLLHRERRYSESEQRWIGWERKRGKLEELVRALVEPQHRPFIDLGSLSRLAPDTRYIITLDADTGLPPGRLRALVGIAAHPLNQPQIDPVARRVVAGYGILQPRIATPLPMPEEITGYHRLFSGQCGTDAYSAATSEVYQDLFGEGSFTGKGLLHVQAFHATLVNRLPENQVLSHDLLEGSLTRCAGISEITLVEEAPMHADVAAARLHRWTRGDWQLLPFIFGRQRLSLALIHRWKMIDNLRRSVVAPAAAALLLLCASTGVVPFAWAVLVVLAAFSAGPLLGALAALAPSRDDIALRPFYTQALADMARALMLGAWHIVQLLDLALVYLDAIARACWRQAVSRHLLLQWTTAAAAQAEARIDLPGLVREHLRTPLAAAGLLLLFVGLDAGGMPVQWPWTLALLLTWSLSGIWTWLASRPPAPAAPAQLTTDDRGYLQTVAYDTWRFYERYVTAEDNHLPPDNVQFSPYTMVAHRTSPTNIGLYLLAATCARELGFISVSALTDRIGATLETLLKLPRHGGHFYNWYDTQTLAVLAPAYVSTVDSGNCSAHLLVVASACELLANDAQVTGDQQSDAETGLSARLRDLATRVRALALDPDYGLLYNRQRRLLHIGLRVDTQQLDGSHYDLLASESRLTSLLAIAKGDVPVVHWAALGRPFFAEGAEVGLRSWSGSMFEYLMPTLVLDEPSGSVLQQAGRTAVALQQAESTGRGTPWGISESAIAAQDHTLAYQYGPQGAPRLALRRTPPDERVIAPYATALALVVAPVAALANLRSLEEAGARGEFGFIESIDYTPQRQAAGSALTLVDTFMAHHQAMILVAICDVLQEGAARRWASRDGHLRAVQTLLHERAPREVPELRNPPQLVAPRQGRSKNLAREFQPLHEALPATQLLGNGRYAVLLRSQGCGFSQWQGQGLNRWRDDLPSEAHGQLFYIQRSKSGPRHTLTARPAPDPLARYGCRMQPDRVIFEAAWPDLLTRCTVWVSPEDDCELRRIEITNTSAVALDLTLSSAAEPTLTTARADEAHPAFSNLFVQARWDAADRALYLRRKPRLPDEQGIHAVHLLALADDAMVDTSPCADRLRWWGRYGSAARPLGAGDAPTLPLEAAAEDLEAPPGQPLDTGMDPMAVISARLHLEPGASTTLTFVTAAAESALVLDALVDKYRHASHVERASSMSHSMASILLRELQFETETWASMLALNTLLSALVTRERPAETLMLPGAALCDRRSLWRHGIGGERPILVAQIRSEEGLALVQTLVRALPLWSAAGIGVDLVVLNGEPPSYLAPVHNALQLLGERQRGRLDERVPEARRAALRLLRDSDLSTQERATLQALARVRLHADGRSLAEHLARIAEEHRRAHAERIKEPPLQVVALRRSALRHPVEPSRGTFDASDGGFHFEVRASSWPERPWINVLANPEFGCHVSEVGGGYVWAGNSRMHQVTRWSNNPVSDPAGLTLLLHDRDSGRVWPLGRVLAEASPRHVEHGIGYTRMRQRIDGIEVTLTWCVDASTAVQQVQVELQSRGTQVRSLRVVAVADWLLGSHPEDRLTLTTARVRLAATPNADAPSVVALTATQLEHLGGFGMATAILAVRSDSASAAGVAGATGNKLATEDWTCDRRELHDAWGMPVLPAHLGQCAGSGLDACAALATPVVLGGGGSGNLTVLLGHAPSPAAAQVLMSLALAVKPEDRLRTQRAQWDARFGSIRVQSPDPLFDALVNHWLPYQTVVCRLWARSGFYQAGGATGFRDQLQDAMALVTREPALLADQIRLGAAHQFAQGDVQHWWHDPGGAGVRTHFSDDRLWLPCALALYVQRTGDAALLDEALPFLEGSAVPPGAEDIYESPGLSTEQATLYEHAARAIDCSLRTGTHGLPLIGTGDWNDGMNRVGHMGRGESVWLAWFICQVIDDMQPLAEARGDVARVQAWGTARHGLATALDDAGWDGQWYRRGYFDDGSPLGSAQNSECRIDLIAQAWAVLSGAGRPERARLAAASAQRELWDADAHLIRLLHPPLQHANPGAGYIQAYPPGVRENGGQYNHGAVWALMAAAQLKQPARAWQLFTALSPAHRVASEQRADPSRVSYAAEPYVMAGDICTHAPHAGRGGWSWYTGSAGWMLRAAVESLCGVVVSRGSVKVNPCLPPEWDSVTVHVMVAGQWSRFVICATEAALARGKSQHPRHRPLAIGQRVDLGTAEAGAVFLMEATPPSISDPEPRIQQAAAG